MARSFNGTSDKAIVSALNLSGQSAITISFWGWWNSFGTAAHPFFEYANPNWTVGGCLLGPDNAAGNYILGFGDATGANVWIDTFTRLAAPAAQWNHFLLVFDRANKLNKVWVGGSPATLTAQTHNNVAYGNFANSNLNLMCRGGSSLFGAGRICEFTVWPGDISGPTVGSGSVSLAESLSGGVPAPLASSTPPLLYLPVMGADSPEPDYSGGQRSATLTGTASIKHPRTRTLLMPGEMASGMDIVSPQVITPFINSVTAVYAPTFFAGLQQLPFIASTTAVYAPVVEEQVDVPFIASTTAVHAPALEHAEVYPSFIASTTVVYALTVQGNLDVPFIASATSVHTPFVEHAEVYPAFIPSHTVVYPIFSLFVDRTGFGPGNGGEGFRLQLAPNGTSETATLAADISDTASLLTLTADGSLPASGGFCLTIDAEVLYVVPVGAGVYRIRHRALSNTPAAGHTAGATATWTDSYDMAIESAANADASFTADIESSGSVVYPGWVMSFDSSQGYLGTDRYPMHVTELVGVFDAGAGSGGTNRLDASQPNAICTPIGVSDDCPAALSVPGLITTDIAVGDVALVRYTNPEASVLELGARSTALQTWYGLKRVSDTDVDVTFTDPDGNIVDGSINGEWFEPVDRFTTVTLPGTDRTFTYGPPRFSERGWPIAALAVRQGTRRVPLWESPTWHNFDYVYSGFDTDATFVQVLINRNGILFASDPEVVLPGPQDIDGPDATWDDNTYYFGASWLVAIFNGQYFVAGPALGGGGIIGPPPVPPSETAPVPSVDFTTGTTVTIPPDVEDGSGGNIPPPAAGQRFEAALV
jgi:hypothetical protein